MKGREGIARRITYVVGVLSHIFVWGGEGGIGEQNGSGNHDIH